MARDEIQLFLPLVDGAGLDLPDAVIDANGVMVANIIRRTWTSAMTVDGRPHYVTASAGHVGGCWDFGLVISCGSIGATYPLMERWNWFDTAAACLEAAAQDACDWIVINSSMRSDQDRLAASALISAMSGPYSEDVLLGTGE